MITTPQIIITRASTIKIETEKSVTTNEPTTPGPKSTTPGPPVISTSQRSITKIAVTTPGFFTTTPTIKRTDGTIFPIGSKTPGPVLKHSSILL